MKRREKIDNQSIDKTLGLFGALSRQELEAAEERASRRFGNVTARTAPVNERFVAVEPASEIAAVRGRRWRLAMVAASAAVFLAVAIGGMVWRQAGSFAVVETADGSVYQIVNGKTQRIPVGGGLDAGQTVRTNGGASAVLKLADGSRVEMRSQSELLLERADDGVRVRLRNGGIIVNAAKQGRGHLYVLTKDVIVSVVGTVFLVNAEEEGSRVAVIEGEVRVQEGSTERKLRSGDQVRTNPAMPSLPLKDEVAWSLQAEAHTASLLRTMTTLLQQPNVVRTPEEPLETFEVDSVRPISPPPSGGRGGPGGRGATESPCVGPGIPLRMELDPRRFAAYGASLRRLIQVAYGKGCFLLSGGPDWVRFDRYDIEAVIPEGSGSYTAQQFRNGEAPRIQRMLQSLLANRFKLSLGREMTDIEVYNLVVVAPGKMQPARDPAPPGSASRPVPTIHARLRTPDFAEMLATLLGRPVIDKTDLKGAFDVHLEWELAEPPVPGVTAGPSSPESSALFRALQDQLGLKLEPARALVETLVIVRAEKPSEN